MQPQWQPDNSQNWTPKQKTAAMMVEARKRGWKDWEVKQRFQEMGINVDEMAYPGSTSSPQYPQYSPFQYNKKSQLQKLQGSNKSDQSSEYVGQMNQSALQDKNLYHMGIGIFGYRDDPGKKEETSWWDDIGEQLGSGGFLGGVKGWLDLGVKGMEAYTGYQQVGIARDQNEMARQNLAFQQNAWGKDYTARRIAYNQNARGRMDWKRANDPLGERYSVEELVPA